ncbi:MAG: alpha/beta hydrolase [Phormidesmis sp. RL_2_1]|nr:alpha/beta hydrolase [Phormidesmis sp. RL_2_1]
MPLPTVILPGYLASAQPYEEMATALTKQGFPAVIVPLRRRDWLPTVGGRSVINIVQALDATAQRMMVDYGCNQINLVGHSAGGWIARIYLGEMPYDVHQSDRDRTFPRPARSHVKTLVTLGTPHISQERWTRKNLDFVNQTYPGAFYDDVSYVCIAGKAVEGKRSDWFTFNSYKLTCGDGFTWGDGVVPVSAAHLAGAANHVLDQVMHSPRIDQLWYGSDSVVAKWSQWLT